MGKGILGGMTGRTFLSVEASLSGRRWLHALDDRAEAVALRIAQDHGLPEIVGRVLAARGVSAWLDSVNDQALRMASSA